MPSTTGLTKKPPLFSRAGADLRDLVVLYIGGPQPVIRSSTTMIVMSAPTPRTTTGATTTDTFETASRSFESGRVFVPIICIIVMNPLAQRVNNHDAVRRYP